MQLLKLQRHIEIVEGKPGSGKSYYAVRRVMDAIMRDRRPVFTNLPLNIRVCRKYLRDRGGPELAALLQPLTREHFSRFLKRFSKMQNFEELYRLSKPNAFRREIVECWEASAGRGIYKGPEADWIPRGAMIVIDEVHQWYRNRMIPGGEKEGGEPGELLTYLTMHRHMLHYVMLITQDQRQIGSSMKTLAKEFVVCMDRAQSHLFWGLKPASFGVPSVFFVAKASHEDAGKGERIRGSTSFPWLPWNQKYFRFYQPFTHAGSAREISRELRRTQAELGVSSTQGGDDVPKQSIGRWINRLVLGTLKRAAFIAIIALVVMWIVSRMIPEPGTQAVVDGAEAVGELTVSDLSDVVVSGIAGGRVYLADGRSVKLGTQHNGVYYCSVESTTGRVLLQCSRTRDYWVCEPGGATRRLGTEAEVRRVVEGFRERLADSTGQAQVAGSED